VQFFSVGCLIDRQNNSKQGLLHAMSVLDAMADHLMGLAPWPDVQGNNPSSIATESPTPGRQRFRNDGPVGMFEVDFSGTLYEGINYVTEPGASTRLARGIMARHGMVFEGELDPGVPGYVRVARECTGLYTGLFVPTSFEGRVCVKRVPDDTPICPARPRTPPEQGELASDVKGAWNRYFAESGISVEEVVGEAWAADGDASSTTSSSSDGSESSLLE